MAKILSIGPDHDRLLARNRELKDCGHHIRGAETRTDALELARSGVFEVILLCGQFLPAYASELAKELHIVNPQNHNPCACREFLASYRQKKSKL